jgi:outer membrane lipoprotein
MEKRSVKYGMSNISKSLGEDETMTIREKDGAFARKQGRGLSVGLLVLLFVSTLIHACATTGEKPSTLPTYEKIPFSQILAAPESYQGRVIRLGGVIITTENHEEETVLEILEKPLGRNGRPKSGDTSGGRFRVVFDRFLDSAVYRPNRPVTIVGEVVGKETAPIGETTYQYPLLSGRDVRLWEERGTFDTPRLHIGIGIGGSSGGVGVGTSF